MCKIKRSLVIYAGAGVRGPIIMLIVHRSNEAKRAIFCSFVNKTLADPAKIDVPLEPTRGSDSVRCSG